MPPAEPTGALPDARIALTTAGSGEAAQELARTLVEERLAACVSVLGPLVSTYRWRGQIETDREHLLWIKTTADRLAALEVRLHQLHDYEVPEFVVLPIAAGSDRYLSWLRAQVQPDSGSP